MSHTTPQRRRWQRRRHRRADLAHRAMIRRMERVAKYRAGDRTLWKHLARDRGAALIETAIVLPLLAMLLAGGLGLGLAMVADVRLEHATGQAANGAAAGALTEDDVRAHIESAGGEMTCFWTGAGPGGCYDDGTEAHRVQVVAETSVQVPFLGEVRPIARASAFTA